jgi:hypothetical protein
VGQALDVELLFDPTALNEPSVSTPLVIESNDPFDAETTVTIGVTVESGPAIELPDGTLHAALPPGASFDRVKTLDLHNGGRSELIWRVSEAAPARVLPASGTIAPGESRTLEVRFSSAGLKSGDHAGRIVFESNDPDRGTLELPVLLHVGEIEVDFVTVARHPHHAEGPGTVEVIVQLPRVHDPRDVLVSSVRAFGSLAPEASPVAFDDTNLDGVDELILQFDRDAFHEAASRGKRPVLSITGEIEDRVWFRGSRPLR